jgi:hypothetical protein
MMNFFNSVEHLEPRCSNCEEVLEYGLNTRYDAGSDSMVCGKCGFRLD